MWLDYDYSLINLDQECVFTVINSPDWMVSLQTPSFSFILFEGSEKLCKKYLNLLAMHMNRTDVKVIDHEDVVKGLGVE